MNHPPTTLLTARQEEGVEGTLEQPTTFNSTLSSLKHTTKFPHTFTSIQQRN